MFGQWPFSRIIPTRVIVAFNFGSKAKKDNGRKMHGLNDLPCHMGLFREKGFSLKLSPRGPDVPHSSSSTGFH